MTVPTAAAPDKGYFDGPSAEEGAWKAGLMPGERAELGKGRSHGCYSPWDDFDGREWPRTPARACNNRETSRATVFSRLHIQGSRRSNVSAGVDARSIEEGTYPIWNGLAGPDRPTHPPKWTTNRLDLFVGRTTRHMEPFVTPPGQRGENKAHGVNAQTRVKKLHEFVTTFIRTTA